MKETNTKLSKIEDFILESKFLGIDKIVWEIAIVRIRAIASLVPIFESFIYIILSQFKITLLFFTKKAKIYSNH